MEQKVKFIIIALVGITVLSCVFLFGAVSSKQSLVRERDDLRKENTVLSGQLSKFQDNVRGYENKIGLLSRQLEELARAKDELQQKYELASRAREELAEKLKSREGRAVTSVSHEIPAGTDAYWGSILKQKTDLEMQLGSLRLEFKSIQISNEQLQREKSLLELDINNLRRESEDLKRQMDYNKKIMDSLAQDLVREKNDKILIQDSFKAIKAENNILTRQLKGLNNRKIELERRLQDFNEEKTGLLRKIDELQAIFKEKAALADNLEGQIDTLRGGLQPEKSKYESVTLPPIVVKPSNPASKQAEDLVLLKGKIVALNRENNFVIVDLGENHGVKVGDTFHVYHDDNSIADITVIQARGDISACDIKKETDAIKIGDEVK